MFANRVPSGLSRSAGIACLVGVLAIAGCNKPQVQTTEAYAGGPMRRPDRILVTPFAVTPQEVQLDQGVSARVQREASDKPLTASQLQVAHAAQSELADAMIRKLQSYGLPAERTPGQEYGRNGSSLIVQGQIVSIDQGNRTRRTLIGLGAGKSSVSADMQLYSAYGADRPRFVSAFDADSTSGRTPGMAEGMGVGAAAGHLLTAAAVNTGMHVREETHGATSGTEASKLGDALAGQIGQFAVSQGWIPTSAIR